MSIECGECENVVYAGHALGCSRARCTQDVITEAHERRECGRKRDDPIHAPGAYRYDGGVIGSHIPHEFTYVLKDDEEQ